MLSISSQAKGRRRPKYSFRAFYTTVLVISALAIISLLAEKIARVREGSSYGLVQRELIESLDHELECKLVHQAKDQCAFIKSHCPNEDAGIFSYLTLYFCDLPKAKPVAFIILASWLALLFTTIGIAASDFFCINLSTISGILGMSESMAGVTFLAFGNGSPDVFSTFAAMSTHSGSLAVGELIGAAGFITAVVAGSMALVREFRVGKKTFVRDIGFFIVATAFTMTFLADGKLLLWECVAMVTFYLFYVFVVVVWHWYLARQYKKKVRDAAARGHYYAPGTEELEVVEEDLEDEDAPAASRRSHTTTPIDAFGALERAQSWRQTDGTESDSDDDRHRKVAAEMASEMRVVRPRNRRKNTVSAIRPSLLGALEFRSVLSSLQRSRSAHSAHIHLRRYSDEALNTVDPHIEPHSEMLPEPAVGLSESRDQSSSARLRAVSMNDVPRVKPLDPAAFTVATIPEIGVVGATPALPPDESTPESPVGGSAPRSPTFSLSPPASTRESRASSPPPILGRHRFDQSLAPPETGMGARNSRQSYSDDPTKHSPPLSQRQDPSERLRLLIPHSRNNSMDQSPSSITRFPMYTDSPTLASARGSKAPSILFSSADAGESSYITSSTHEEETFVHWWPYRFLPSPYVLWSTLFPTLCTWKNKSLWDKFVSLASAPSIFMLAITLPVVESEGMEEEDNEDDTDEDRSRDREQSRRNTHVSLPPDSPSLEPARSDEWHQYRRHSRSRERRKTATSPATGMQSGSAAVAVGTENEHDHLHPHQPVRKNSTLTQGGLGSPMSIPAGQRDWNRWLLSIQIFTAPLFLVFVVWINQDDDYDSRTFIKSVLYALLISLITYAILLVTTTPETPPKYRFMFCFVGFVVSIAWISTIAGEVVAILKAFGIILGISDAILGLTIFAVGNSLGDLVADITVARLGYPVMALSACFGGPMLNILLGIGLGGLYMTITDASEKQHKHPGKPMKYVPYEIEVSGTLMISAITLLVTLISLLIAVPMNKWMMNRKIGFGLIGLWTVSTIVNVAVEITGVWGNAAIKAGR